MWKTCTLKAQRKYMRQKEINKLSNISFQLICGLSIVKMWFFSNLSADSVQSQLKFQQAFLCRNGQADFIINIKMQKILNSWNNFEKEKVSKFILSESEYGTLAEKREF